MATPSGDDKTHWQFDFVDSGPPLTSADVIDLNLNLSLNGASKCPSNTLESTSSLPAEVASSTVSVECAEEDDSLQERPEVEVFARRLIGDVVDSVTGRHLNSGGATYDEYCKTMLRIVKELSDRYGATFGEMTSRLLADTCQRQIVGDVDQRQNSSDEIQMAFDGVVRELLADGRCNWGRVATVYALASWLARWCLAGVSIGHGEVEQLIDDLKTFAGEVVVNRLTTWIGANGGWVRAYYSYRIIYCGCCLNTRVASDVTALIQQHRGNRLQRIEKIR